jgi:hypothetical protein
VIIFAKFDRFFKQEESSSAKAKKCEGGGGEKDLKLLDQMRQGVKTGLTELLLYFSKYTPPPPPRFLNIVSGGRN